MQINSDYFYMWVLGASSISIGLYFLYDYYQYTILISQNLGTLLELKNYGHEHLKELFFSMSPSELKNNFLDNKFLYNYLKNFCRLIIDPSTLLWDLPFEDRQEILKFLNEVKSDCSFEKFKRLSISKKNFYLLIAYTNKLLFMLPMGE